MLPLSANLRTKGRFAILKLVYFACLGFLMTTCSSTSKRFHLPRYLGAFLWDDQDQDQCSKITWIMFYQNNELMDPCPQWIHRLIWCNITRVISDHWSWSSSSQRNAPFAEFILEIGQWGSKGPPFCNFRGPFSKRGSLPKGILHGSDSPDALPPFWNILGNCKSLGSNYCRIPHVCLVK